MPPSVARSLFALSSTPWSFAAASSRLPVFQSLPCLRYASTKGNKSANKRDTARDAAKAKKRRKERLQYKRDPLKRALSFPLCDAMRYLRACEVGYPGLNTKYELAINLRTNRNSPVVRNGLRLPNPVDTSQRIAVICPPDSASAREALAAGATIVGEDNIFDAVREGKFEFERCLCHTSSYDKLLKSGIARLLGPRGLMPNPKNGTVLKSTTAGVESLRGGTQFRERVGTIRLPIGRLSHTPEQLMENIKAVMALIKRDVERLNERAPKEIHDVVLSSPRGPGFILSGNFMGEESLEPSELLEA